MLFLIVLTVVAVVVGASFFLHACRPVLRQNAVRLSHSLWKHPRSTAKTLSLVEPPV